MDDRISTDLFRSIVDALNVSGASASDRAASTPGAVSGRAIILALDRPGAIAEVIDVREISRREIAFVFHRSMNVGTGFQFCLRSQRRGKLEAIACLVERWFPLGAQQFSIVARFGQKTLSPLSPAQGEMVFDSDTLCREVAETD